MDYKRKRIDIEYWEQCADSYNDKTERIIQKHGKALSTTYKDAILKRAGNVK